MFSSNIIPGLQNIHSIQSLQNLQIPTSQAVVSTSAAQANGGEKEEKEDVKPPTTTSEGSFQGHVGNFLVGLKLRH